PREAPPGVMPVILGEVSVLTTPLSLVRLLAITFGCAVFSLVAADDPGGSPFKIFCMFTWCFFFTMTVLILLVEFIQFQSLVPLSWKNLPITVATLAALMTLTASIGFPWLVLPPAVSGRMVAATVFSCLTFLAYITEAYLLKVGSSEQRGYMASAPGLLKVFQVFGGCVIFVAVVDHDRRAAYFWWCLAVYCCCFLMSLGTILVMLGDCAGRCPLPFSRVLAAFSSLSVLLYVTATVFWVTAVLGPGPQNQNPNPNPSQPRPGLIMSTVMTCLNLLAYTVDLAFSIKLCARA
uniref:MARVEL domain-containing protein n=1 Tax=Lepisosteus oculatus TaxID=7918 RepID=W5NMK8_LEPOC